MQTADPLEQVAAELRELRLIVSELKDKVDALTGNSSIAGLPTEHPHIYTSPEMHQGEPTIRGTAITVRTIVENFRVNSSIEDTLDVYPFLSRAQVYDALAYYYDHIEEIEDYIRENQEALQQKSNRAST